jgi:hypothetical protein
MLSINMEKFTTSNFSLLKHAPSSRPLKIFRLDIFPEFRFERSIK